MIGRITFVGPNPHAARSGHAGGQMTAAAGIERYARAHGYSLEYIDTFVDSFSPPSFLGKLRLGADRVRVFWRRLRTSPSGGVLLFVGARFSFFERILMALVARRSGVVTIFCLRDGAFTGWMTRSALLRAIVPRLLRVPTRIVVQGNAARNILVDAGVPAEKFLVVRNWLPDDFQVADVPRHVTPSETLRLVFIGWLVKEKGLRELFQACAALSERYRFCLDLIGGGSLEAELRAFASDHHLEDVRFLGWLSPVQIRAHLEQAHVFVLPSYFEGFPNALLEAMATGLPAVCSDVGAIADSVGDGISGLIVPSHDVSALANAIEQYLARPALVQEHGAAALARVRELHDADANLELLFSCFAPN